MSKPGVACGAVLLVIAIAFGISRLGCKQRVAKKEGTAPASAVTNINLADGVVAKEKAAKKTPPAGAVISIDLGGGVTMEFVWVEAGEFNMGKNRDKEDVIWGVDETTHRVKISKGFWMGKCEVTQEQWERVMGNNPSHFKDAGSNAPVDHVSWNDCQDLFRRLNGLGLMVDGKKVGEFRLPSEAEWEYAAMGGSRSKGYVYSGSDNFDDVAWCKKEGSKKDYPHPVGGLRGNELGLYDMSGNIAEWCADWYGPYSTNAVTDPTGPSTGELRVVRGGTWLNYEGGSRCAARYFEYPHHTENTVGLRCAMGAF